LANLFLSSHWPASGIGGHNFGYRRDGTLNFSPHRLCEDPRRGCMKHHVPE
jgi:hypothetical protein